ncbi:hypothetical protein [Chelativorans sp.]|uniref:hypothetical protein n=1 Tax=Chelativorans sp. TaxID=2203393 RepID=UPI00281127E3|nr:hypothetical protein [Chelativorans sp.]
MTKPLQVSFVAEVSEAIRRAAAERKLRPQVLTAALMRAVVMDGDLIESVLDGDNPRRLAGGHARDATTGLTLLQEGIVYLVGLNAGKDGACRLSISGFHARLEGASWHGVQTALGALCSKGLLRRVGTGSRYVPQPYALTAEGRALYRHLAASETDGGEG